MFFCKLYLARETKRNSSRSPSHARALALSRRPMCWWSTPFGMVTTRSGGYSGFDLRYW